MRRSIALPLLLSAACSPFDRAQLPQGYGAITEGALSAPAGFDECEVTSLADDGEGTLRFCLSQGGRRVRFRVAGTIILARDLVVNDSFFITIAGETAPSPGVTIDISAGSIEFSEVTDIVIRHLRLVSSNNS